MAFVGIQGGANTFVPTMGPLSGNLQIQLSRRASSFSTKRYAREVMVEQPVGHYLRIDAEEQIRMVGGLPDQWVWGIDNPAPSAQNIPFDLTNTYRCTRYAPAWQFSTETVRRSVWDIQAEHAQMRMVTAMSIRARKAAKALSADASWTSSGTKYANMALLGSAAGISITGAYGTDGNIMKAFAAAAVVVQQNSAGAVTPGTDLIAVMNPITASLLAQTDELKAYIKTTPYAPEFAQGKLYPAWMLPPALFNVADIVIEDAVQVTSAKGAASTTRSYIFPDNAIAFISRPAGLMDNVGSSFATLSAFICAPNNLGVWTWFDPINGLQMGRVVDETDFVVTSPLTGVYLTSVTAT